MPDTDLPLNEESWTLRQLRARFQEYRSLGASDIEKLFALAALRQEPDEARAAKMHPGKDVTCECGRGPVEITEHQDEAGVKFWWLALLCTECLDETSIGVAQPQED